MSLNPTPATNSHMLHHINPSGLYDPSQNAYSPISSCLGAGRLSFIAGQGGESADGSLSASFAEQVERALGNLECALQSIGASYSDIAKLTVLIVDHEQTKLGIWSQAWLHRLSGRSAPACTLIPVSRLALDAMQIEIDATVWKAF